MYFFAYYLDAYMLCKIRKVGFEIVQKEQMENKSIGYNFKQILTKLGDFGTNAKLPSRVRTILYLVSLLWQHNNAL